MIQRLNALTIVDRIRKRVEDRSDAYSSVDEKLQAVDAGLEGLFTTMRLAGAYHHVEDLTITQSDLVFIEQGVYEYTLPEWVADVVQLGALSGGSYSNVARAYSNERNYAKSDFAARGLLWIWMGGLPGRIQLRGTPEQFTGYQLRVMRAYPPLVHVNILAGSNFAYSSTVNGSLIERDGVYDNWEWEVTGTDAAKGTRFITTNWLRQTLTADRTGGTFGSPTTAALVLPLNGDQMEFLVLKASEIILSDVGGTDRLEQMAPMLARAQERFEASLRTRDTSEPKRLHNWRRRR